MTCLRTLPRAGAIAALVLAALGGGDPLWAAEQLSKHQSWTLFMHKSADATTCFAASQPTESLPKGANRDAIHFYVSAWPKDGVKSEVSVKLGYPIKQGSSVSVKIGSDTFKLFSDDQRGYVADPTEELKLVEAMKKGSSMQVLATSQRGTDTTDTYSLSGVSQALQAMAEKCP